MFENVIRDDDVEGIWREWQAFATAGHEGCSDIVQGGERTRLRALALSWLYAGYRSRARLGVPYAPAAVTATDIKNVFAVK